MESDRQYYLRRAAEELQAAERAQTPKAELLHRTLAENYAHIVESEDVAAPSADRKRAATN
jgi:hypothetical protein